MCGLARDDRMPGAAKQGRVFDGVVLVHAENAYQLKNGRKGVSRYTDIWILRSGRWLCTAAHITVHKTPAM
jgi:hypothetical protein